MFNLGVIPARWGAARFPGKALAVINDKPMIWHVYKQAMASGALHKCVVATDDKRISQACEEQNIPFIMTRESHPTGTDRLAEVAEKVEASLYLNIQGDEPMLAPGSIRKLAGTAMTETRQVLNGYCVIREPSEIIDINVVKVVMARSGIALAFSRSPIPYPKSGEAEYFRVVGLYAFTRSALLEFPKLPIGQLERSEGIELYRYLESGRRVQMVEVGESGHAVDTPDDLERVRGLMKSWK